MSPRNLQTAPPMNKKPLHLFEGFGVELEYMIVDDQDLNVLPVTDKIIYHVAGRYENEIEQGEICWSNELALHVIELKTNGPASDLARLPDLFQNDIRRINTILSGLGGRLMPGGTHPFMNPLTETRLWPHEYNAIYEAYDRIFNCKGHGWSNLQSIHLNLPFYNDAEFARLHAAVRLVLPILPALAAGSPVMDGKLTGFHDTRLEVYRFNQKKIPLAAGEVIPEAVFSKKDYEKVILHPLYQSIAPYDPDKILQDEWLNSRGAIARFERNTIEIRVLDIQECPLADMAVLCFIIAMIQDLVNETTMDVSMQRSFEIAPLADIFQKCIVRSQDTVIQNEGYLRAFGFPESEGTAGELLAFLKSRLIPETSVWSGPLNLILKKGSLAKRILSGLNQDLRHEKVKEVYGSLCQCLNKGELYDP